VEGGKRQSERLAARFAAKEAVLKALGTGMSAGIAWTDIEVRMLASGAPTIVLAGGAAAIAAERRISVWHVSLSHAGGLALASVIAESAPE
jgi:holo-[acyl-carrier protein] synthase